MDVAFVAQGAWRVSAGLIAILVAVISGSGVPIWLLNRFDKRNTQQHGENMAILKEARDDLREVKQEVRDVKDDVRDVRKEVKDHIAHHRETEDGFTRRDFNI